MPRSPLLALLAPLTTCALVLSACGGGQGDDVVLTDKVMGEPESTAIDEAVRGVLEPLGDSLPGLYLGVWDPEDGYYTPAYGDAEVGERPADAIDQIRIGTATGTLTASAVLQLVDEGEMALDEPVGTYLPKSSGDLPAVGEVTVRQLLSMTSGLPDYLTVPDGVVAEVTADPQRVWTTEELLEVALRGEVAEPGTAGYSSTNYLLLQEAVESVTGQELAEVLRERVTEPLGLEGTMLTGGEDTVLPEPASHGYLTDLCVPTVRSLGGTAKVGTDATEWNTSWGQGAAGAHSLVGDLGVWAAAVGSGTLLDSPLAEEQRGETTELTEGISYGLGVMTVGSWVGHTGSALGWQTLMLHDPDSGTTFVAAANTCGDVEDVLWDVLEALYPDTV